MECQIRLRLPHRVAVRRIDIRANHRVQLLERKVGHLRVIVGSSDPQNVAFIHVVIRLLDSSRFCKPVPLVCLHFPGITLIYRAS